MIKVFSNKGEYWSKFTKDGITYPVYISSQGRVVDKYFINRYLVDNGNGYFTFSAYPLKATYIHRAVAMMFIQGDHSLQVNHIDGNKANNNVNNLEWMSGSDNIKHAHTNGLMRNRTENGKINILTKEQVIYLYTEVIKNKKGITTIAKEMGIPRTTASSIINKRSRSDITNSLDEQFKCQELI